LVFDNRRAKLLDGNRQAQGARVHSRSSVPGSGRVGPQGGDPQVIDLLRLIHTTKRKTVYTRCSIPLDIPIDELVTWNQLTGDRRLVDAPAECDDRGWDVLPLAPKELTRLLSALWSTKKAADPWIEKNPRRHIEI
jgi:hypothetical protein